MQISTKHIFNIHKQIYKGLKLPDNYVDGILINTDFDTMLPLGTKCIYSKNIKNKKFTKIVTPFPIIFNNSIINKPLKIRTRYLKTLKESSFLYKHKLIYLEENIKASEIPINEIIKDTKYNFSSTIIMNINKCNIYFLNKFLKLSYKYQFIVYPILKKVEDIFKASFNKGIKISFTILNLNNCKPSFNDDFDGVGVKIQLYNALNNNLFGIHDIFTCLYSNNHKDLYYLDGINLFSSTQFTSLNNNIDKLNKYIKSVKNNN